MYRNGYYYGGWGNPNYGQMGQMSPSAAPYRGYQNQTPQMEAQMEQKPSLQVPWVNGEVGAQAYIIPPNSVALLMDSDNPIFYIKTSDLSGKATIQAFKYEEIKSPIEASKSGGYVTKEEFEAFKASILNKNEEEAKI